jgi:hypothetical protein
LAQKGSAKAIAPGTLGIFSLLSGNVMRTDNQEYMFVAPILA